MPTTPSLYVAWAATDSGNINVWSVATTTGVTVNGAVSNQAPALAVFNLNLFTAWAGTDNQGTINAASSPNCSSGGWTSNKFGDFTLLAPALAAFNNYLGIAWIGTPDGKLNMLFSSGDVTTWSTRIHYKEIISNMAPAAIGGPFQFPAFAWVDQSNTSVLALTGIGPLLGKLAGVGTQSGQQPAQTIVSSSQIGPKPGVALTNGPALALCNGLLYLAFTDNGGNVNLWSSPDGITWATVALPPGQTATSGFAPALAVGGTTPTATLYLAWTSNVSATNQQIMVFPYNVAVGTTPAGWGNQITLGSTGTPNSAKSAPALAFGSITSP